MLVIQNNLPYIFIRLPQYKDFKLNVDCIKSIVTQNNKIMSVIMTSNIYNVFFFFCVCVCVCVYFNILCKFWNSCVCKKTVNECDDNTNVTQNIQSENNDIFSEFITMNNKYKERFVSKTSISTNEKTFSSQNSN